MDLTTWIIVAVLVELFAWWAVSKGGLASAVGRIRDRGPRASVQKSS